MPKLKGLDCSIELVGSGETLKEYGTAYADGVVATFVAIPDHPEPFRVHLKSTDYIAPGLGMWVYIDGIFQCNRIKKVPALATAGQPDKRAFIDLQASHMEQRPQPHSGIVLSREWNFERLAAADSDQASELPPDVLSSMGLIEIVVLRLSNVTISERSRKPGSRHPSMSAPSPANRSARRVSFSNLPPLVVPTLRPYVVRRSSVPNTSNNTSKGGGFAGLFDGPADESRDMHGGPYAGGYYYNRPWEPPTAYGTEWYQREAYGHPPRDSRIVGDDVKTIVKSSDVSDDEYIDDMVPPQFTPRRKDHLVSPKPQFKNASPSHHASVHNNRSGPRAEEQDLGRDRSGHRRPLSVDTASDLFWGRPSGTKEARNSHRSPRMPESPEVERQAFSERRSTTRKHNIATLTDPLTTPDHRSHRGVHGPLSPNTESNLFWGREVAPDKPKNATEKSRAREERKSGRERRSREDTNAQALPEAGGRGSPEYVATPEEARFPSEPRYPLTPDTASNAFWGRPHTSRENHTSEGATKESSRSRHGRYPDEPPPTDPRSSYKYGVPAGEPMYQYGNAPISRGGLGPEYASYNVPPYPYPGYDARLPRYVSKDTSADPPEKRHKHRSKHTKAPDASGASKSNPYAMGSDAYRKADPTGWHNASAGQSGAYHRSEDWTRTSAPDHARMYHHSWQPYQATSEPFPWWGDKREPQGQPSPAAESWSRSKRPAPKWGSTTGSMAHIFDSCSDDEKTKAPKSSAKKGGDADIPKTPEKPSTENSGWSSGSTEKANKSVSSWNNTKESDILGGDWGSPDKASSDNGWASTSPADKETTSKSKSRKKREQASSSHRHDTGGKSVWASPANFNDDDRKSTTAKGRNDTGSKSAWDTGENSGGNNISGKSERKSGDDKSNAWDAGGDNAGQSSWENNDTFDAGGEGDDIAGQDASNNNDSGGWGAGGDAAGQDSTNNNDAGEWNATGNGNGDAKDQWSGNNHASNNDNSGGWGASGDAKDESGWGNDASNDNEAAWGDNGDAGGQDASNNDNTGGWGESGDANQESSWNNDASNNDNSGGWGGNGDAGGETSPKIEVPGSWNTYGDAKGGSSWNNASANNGTGASGTHDEPKKTMDKRSETGPAKLRSRTPSVDAKPYRWNWNRQSGSGLPSIPEKEPARPLYRFPSDLAEEKGLEHQVHAGPAKVKQKQVRKIELMDELGTPYAVFKFRYRSREMLKSILGDDVFDEHVVKPNDPENVARDKLMHLSKEEVIEQLLKARSPAASGE